MPGTNAGTGKPLHLKCAQCKKQTKRTWLSGGRIIYTSLTGRLVRTGKVRGEPKPYGSHLRMLGEHHQYECLDCGHVGWTRHVDILHKPLKAGNNP